MTRPTGFSTFHTIVINLQKKLRLVSA